MAIVINKSRPVPTIMRNVKYDHTNEPDARLSTVNTDKLALFQFNLAMRTTDDRGNPGTGVVYFDSIDLNPDAVTYNGSIITHNAEIVTYTP